MTLRLSRSVGERPLPKEGLEHTLSRHWAPVIKELERGANAHVVLAAVTTAGGALEPPLGRIVLVEVDTSHPDWLGGSVALPDSHTLGDEFRVFDVGGSASVLGITVTSSSAILGAVTITANFGSLRLTSDGTRWLSGA